MNVIIVGNILLFICCLVIAVLMIKAVKRSKVLLYHSVNKTIDSAVKRKEKEEQLRLEDGNQEKTSFFYRIDLSLARSGLISKFPFLTTELFLTVVIVVVAGVFALGLMQSFLIGMIGACLAVFFFYAVLYLLTARNYKKTEKQIISFVGMMKNYSRTSDDLLSILKNVSVYMQEPMKSVIEECQAEAAATGDLSAALTRMQLKIEHPQMQKIIGNLEICSRRKANYAVIIDRSMQQLRAYIASQEENKRMVNNARKTILMILGIGVISVRMLDDFAEGGVINFLQQSFGGRCILFYMFCVILYSFWKMLSMGNKG